jgi:hypothetical protein
MLIPPLQDYRTSRQALLALAERSGATLSRVQHPRTGPDGEALFTDVARFGAAPDATHTVVLIASGTHGVEGHAGWGLQRLLLEGGRLDALAEGVAVVLIHAVNPFGMAWSRRVDHENIDVNRNFIDFASPLPTNDRYAEIDPIMNPRGDTFDPSDLGWQADALEWMGRVGMETGFRTISGGQYEVPDGIQFGGTGMAWSRQTLERIWREQTAGARAVFHIDIHTGLGPCGGLTVFQTADEDEPAAEVAKQWYPVWREGRTRDDAPLQQGVLGPGFDAVVTGERLSVPIVIEFGTEPDVTVLTSMRADNWLHHHGDPRSELGESIRAATRAAFFVDDVGWRTQVAEQGTAVIDAALDTASARIEA